MYILVKKTDVSNEEILNMYHETMPDGRLILPISDLRMLGSIPNCQIVASAKELKELIKINAEEVANNKVDGVQGDGTEDGNTVEAGGQTEATETERPEDTGAQEGTVEQPEETAESENKIEEPITEEE
jgi:hypothetical protein